LSKQYGVDDYGLISRAAIDRVSGSIGSDALLRALVRTFSRHAERTGKSFDRVRLELVNGVMP
jgi:hypothetical protein